MNINVDIDKGREEIGLALSKPVFTLPYLWIVVLIVHTYRSLQKGAQQTKLQVFYKREYSYSIPVFHACVN